MEFWTQIPKKVRIIFIVLVVVAVGALSTSIYLWSSSRGENSVVTDEKELAKLVQEIGMIVMLPNETPTLATVSDPEKLRDQAFFANSLVGDKVLIYTQSRKAILWRPSIRKIIEISPLSINNSETPEAR